MSTRLSTKVIHTSLGLPSTHGDESADVAGLWIWNAGHEDVIISDSDEETNWNSIRSSSIRTNTGHGTLQGFSDFEEDEDEMNALEGSFHHEIADVPFKMDATKLERKLERRMSDRSITKSIGTCSRSIDTFAYDDDIVATFDDGAIADEVIEAVSTVAYKQGHRRTFEDQRAKLAITIASELCSRASDDSLSIASHDDHNSVHEYALPDDDLKPPPAPQEDETSNSDSDYLHSPGSMSKYVVRMARSPKNQTRGNSDSDDGSEDPRVEESDGEADSRVELSQKLSLDQKPAAVELSKGMELPELTRVEESDSEATELSQKSSLDQKPAAVELSEISSKAMELPELTSYEPNDMEPEETKPRPPDLSSVEDESQILQQSKSSSYEDVVVTSTDSDEGLDDSGSMMSSVVLSLPDDSDRGTSSYMEITVDDSGVASQDASDEESTDYMEMTVDDSGRASRDTAGDDAREELIALLQKVKSQIINGIQRGANRGTITLDEHISDHHNSVVDDMNTDDCLDDDYLQSMASSEESESCFSLTIRPGLTKQISGLTTHSFSKRTLAEDSISITGTARTIGSTFSIVWKKVVPKSRMNYPGRRQSTTMEPHKHKSPPWSSQGLPVVAEGDDEGATRNSAPELSKESRKKASLRRTYANVDKSPHDFIGSDPEAVWTKVEVNKRFHTRRNRQWKSEGHVKVRYDIRNTRSASLPDLTVALSDIPTSDVDQEETKTHPGFDRSPSSMEIQGLLPSKFDPNDSRRSSRSHHKRLEKKAKLEELNSMMGQTVGVQRSPGSESESESESKKKKKKKLSLSEKHQEVKNLREKLRQSFGNVLKGSQQKLREAFTKTNSSHF